MASPYSYLPANLFGRPRRDARGERMPVTVISGYLGAGKTTLLRALMTTAAGARTAVVVNEFADLPIDGLLLQTVSPHVAVLGNGCLCCRVDAELTATLRHLRAQRNAGLLPPFEQVLIETSGLVDPAPVMQTFLSDRGLVEQYHLRGLVTLVDALFLARVAERPPELTAQISVADRLLVTKRDLVSAGELARVEEELASLNPLARQGFADHGNADGAWITSDAMPGAPDPCAASSASHPAPASAFAVTHPRPLAWPAFSQFLSTLVALRGPELMRMKGLVDIEGCAGPIVIQAMQHVVHPPTQLQVWPPGPRTTRLAVISRTLDVRQVQALLHAVGDLAGP